MATLPIRVIDIACSLVLSKKTGGVSLHAPIGWDFHVISHTWSLDVRKLSEDIGRKVSSNSYNEAFQSADFRQNVCYGQLVDFLLLLANDGVERVWFDALCINQKDDGEKGREVSNMGAYYSNSMGCYVLINGIGQGYKAWKSYGGINRGEIIEEMPRWFRRVWTFQEFLLPKKLYFLVAGLSPSTIVMCNERIRDQNSKVGFCACCLLTVEQYSAFLSIAKDGRNLGGVQDEDFLEVQEVCTTCRTLPLVRKTKVPVDSEGSTIYFVEREAYIFIVGLERWEILLDASPQTWPSSHWRCGYQNLIDLYRLLVQAYEPSPWVIVSQVGERECSQGHEEDRILSILALLGLDGKLQVRTGKTLEEQIVDVGNQSNSHAFIRSLCAVDYQGNVADGMSWAPNFHGPGARHELQGTIGGECAAEVRQVAREGVQLSGCQILSGHLLYSRTQEHFYIQGTQLQLLTTFTGTGHLSSHIQIPVGLKPQTIGQLHLHLPGVPDLCGPVWGALYDSTTRIEISVWIVLLGTTATSSASMDEKFVALVCVGNVDGYLHKIGLISFPHTLGFSLFQTCLCKRDCKIGGFGDDLTPYVALRANENFPNFKHHRLWDSGTGWRME
ncbi:hypothetical protein L7F22_055127 [Adiantum nelumboides]|nr:hypothetical protein [Adiantum nelumboides]